MKKKQCNHKIISDKGLTFIEMLIATTMVTVIAVALYGVLSNGINVWQKVNEETPQIDMNLFFERLELELRNCIYFKSMKFTGEKDGFSFPAVVIVPLRNNGFSEGMGKVSYSFDKGEGTLYRSYTDYNRLNNLKAPSPRPLMHKIDALNFSYYFFNKNKQQFFWSDVWPPREIKEKEQEYPQAIRVSMILSMGNMRLQRNKTINIPVAGKQPEEL